MTPIVTSPGGIGSTRGIDFAGSAGALRGLMQGLAVAPGVFVGFVSRTIMAVSLAIVRVAF